MSLSRRQWDRLQTKWAAGDGLCGAEESARQAYAHADASAARELEVFRMLEQSLACGESKIDEHALIEKVLGSVRGQQPSRLRLVRLQQSPGHSGPPASKLAASRGRAVAVLGAAACTALAIGGILVARMNEKSQASAPQSWSPPGRAESSLSRSELAFTSGAVQIGGRAANVGAVTLQVGERITAEQGHACLTIDPAIDVCLARESSVEIASLHEHDLVVLVARGTAVAALGKRPRGSTFTLAAGAISATARGTAFGITRSTENRGVEVLVMEGEVEVSGSGDPKRRVLAHQRWSSKGESSPSAVASVGRSDEARLWRLLAPRDLWRGAELGVLDLSAETPDTRVFLEDEGPFGLPLRTFAPAGKQRLRWQDPSGRETTREVVVTAGERHPLVAPGAHLAAPPISVGTPSAGALLRDARRELSRGNRRAALALYRQLRSSYASSQEAFTVLVTLGKLELEIDSATRALKTFETYLARGGPLGPEALAGKIRALRALHRTSEEARAIERYLALYPSGFDAPGFRSRFEALSAR